MTKIPNSKPVLVIEYWNLRFVCNLVLGVWDFIDSTTPILPRHHHGLRLLDHPQPEGGSHTPNGVKEEHEHRSHIPQGKTEHAFIGLHWKNDEEHHQGGPQAV